MSKDDLFEGFMTSFIIAFWVSVGVTVFLAWLAALTCTKCTMAVYSWYESVTGRFDDWLYRE